MEKKEENQPMDRLKMVKNLREMTEVSLSHMPDDEYEETLKLLKAFFGEYFGIPDEYTFSELQKKVLESNEQEEIKERIIRLTNTIDRILYTEENPNLDSFKIIRDDFINILYSLVPAANPKSAEKKNAKQPFFGMFGQKKEKTGNPAIIKPQITIEKEILSAKKIHPAEIKNIPKETVKLKDNLSPDNTVKNPIPKKNPIQNIKEKQKSIENNDAVSKALLQAPGSLSLEDEIKTISDKFQKIQENNSSNAFLELELKSLLGDFKLFQLNQSEQAKERISQKISNIKARMERI